jgi:hypothetical protein
MATVTMDLDEYLRLKKFKDEHPKSYIRVFADGQLTDERLISTEQALRLMTEINSSLEQNNYTLRLKIADLEHELERIKKMSVFEFLRWRYKNND